MSTPLLTTLDEDMDKPPRLPVRPELNVLVEETTLDEDTVVGVADPVTTTEDNFIFVKVIASVLLESIFKIVNNYVTMVETLPRTSVMLFVFNTIENPTFKLLSHFQPSLVYPLMHEVQ